MNIALPALARTQPSPFLATLWRYSLSVAGPVAVSGAHFLASLLFLRNLSAAEFGIFSFVLVASSFAMSVSGAGLVLPATHSMMAKDERTTAAVFRLAVAAGLIFAVVLTAAAMTIGASLSHAAPLGLFGAALAYRWFVRSLAYIEGRVPTILASDLLYGALVVSGLGAMIASHTVSLRGGAIVLLLAASFSLAPFGREFLRRQREGLAAGRLRDYLPAFRNVTGWSLMGVALTEMTLNAHAYLVTFISGPGAFALPALGMLLMRPAALVQSALPDMERPAMMRAFAARDDARLAHILRDFRAALALALLATVLLATSLLAFAPHLLLRQGYGLGDAALAALLSAAIMAVRSARAPLGVLLQAAGEFKALARLSGWSAAISLAATLALLLAFGPLASLGGILLGDVAILIGLRPLAIKARSALHG
jgi:O-antigen/teichoic acid export membrane protein